MEENIWAYMLYRVLCSTQLPSQGYAERRPIHCVALFSVRRNSRGHAIYLRHIEDEENETLMKSHVEGYVTA